MLLVYPKMMFKRFVPTALKKPFWWLFKAPQHRLGLFVYWVEIKGHLILLLTKLFSGKHKNLRPITICVSNKNRSDALINYLSESLLQAKYRNLIYLSVYDCGSDDADELATTLKSKWGEHLYYETKFMPFARSKAMNSAVRNAITEHVFITDADVSLPIDIVEKVNLFSANNRIWFPVCQAYNTIEETSKSWYTEGKGILACTRKQFEEVGGYDENFITWGGEDTDLWLRFWQKNYFCCRTNEKNLIHHWHLSVDGAAKQWHEEK